MPFPENPSRRPGRLLLGALLAFGLGGCSSLPNSGPSKAEIDDYVKKTDNPLGLSVVELTPDVVRRLHAVPERSLRDINRLRSNRPVDRLGPGDVVSVTVYESGPGLFGNKPRTDTDATPPGSTSETLPNQVIDRNGNISVPYAGLVPAAGRTTAAVQGIIAGRLASQTTNPQVLVNLVTNNSNVVYVSGDVKNPGRYNLPLTSLNLLDVVALAGGPTHSPQDTLVKVTRRGQDATTTLNRVQGTEAENIPVEPGDRVQVDYRSRTYLSFGATGRVSQIPFEAATVSMAEAVARTGGLDDSRANPEAVYLFRFEDAADAHAVTPPPTPGTPPVPPNLPGVPVVYEVNMRNPETYFTIQQFAMKDKDLIFIANAPTVQVYKFLQLIYSFATPAYAAKTFAN